MLLLLARNRNRHVLPVFLWLAAMEALAMSAGAAVEGIAEEFALVTDGVAVLGAALATVWLLSGGSPAPNIGRVLVRTLLGFGCVTVLGAVGMSGLDPGNAILLLFVTGFFGGVLLMLMSLALLCCRRRVTPSRLLRFTFWFVLCVPFGLGTSLGLLGAVIDSFDGGRAGIGDLSGTVAGGAAVGLLIGFAAFLLVAPLLWLAARGHFRARWAADFAWAAPRIVPPVVPLAVAAEAPPTVRHEESLK